MNSSAAASGLTGLVRELITAQDRAQLAKRVGLYFSQTFDQVSEAPARVATYVQGESPDAIERAHRSGSQGAECFPAQLSGQEVVQDLGPEPQPELRGVEQVASLYTISEPFENYLFVPYVEDDTPLGLTILTWENESGVDQGQLLICRNVADVVTEMIRFKLNSWQVEDRLQAFEIIDDFYVNMNDLGDYEENLSFCLEAFLDLFDARHGSIMIYDNEIDSLQVRHTTGELTDDPLTLSIGEGVAGQSLQDDEIILVPDVGEHPAFEDFPEDERSLKSLLCIPLSTPRRPVGVINITSRAKYRDFDPDQVPGLHLIQSRVAAALENHQNHRKLREVADTDALTSIYNRRFARQFLEQQFDRFRQSGTRFGVLLLDLDKFKQINDKYGHNAGDEVLIEFANLLREAKREQDLAARFGGDEFILLLPESDLGTACRQARNHRDLIDEFTVTYEDSKLRPRASLGLAEVQHDDPETVEQLLNVADQRLYTAKDKTGLSLQVPESKTRVDGTD